jgi:hypothetical protein
MIRASYFLPAFAAMLLAGYGDKSQPPLDVTMRSGGTFLLVRRP